MLLHPDGCDGPIQATVKWFSPLPPFPPLANPEWTSLYEYTSDLLCLDFCRPSSEHQCQALIGIRTPLCAAAWDRALVSHPDRAFTHHVSQGLHQGFRIGFNHRAPLKLAASNVGSAYRHQTVISEYIDKELSLGRMLGNIPECISSPSHTYQPVWDDPKRT